MENLFLTEIAKDYILDASVRLGALPYKEVGRISKNYTIIIDNKKLHCIPRIIFTLFHEIGHVVLCHFDREKDEKLEVEADAWAIKELALKDECCCSDNDFVICYRCITNKSDVCLREYFFCTRAKCYLRLSVCVKRQNILERTIYKSDDPFIICKKCPQGRGNMLSLNENTVQKSIRNSCNNSLECR